MRIFWTSLNLILIKFGVFPFLAINPLRSTWSNSVIVDFPPNLETSNQVTNILSDAQVEEETIKLSETLSAAGIDTHIADSVPNPASGTGTYFKHQAVNLAFDFKEKNENNLLQEVNTTDLQSHLESISNNTYITLTKPAGSTSAYANITATLQQFLQIVVDSSTTIYDNLVDLVT